MKKSPIILVALLTCLNMTACSFVTERDTNTIFIAPLTFSQTGEKEMSEKWWLDFNDPDLNVLVEQALGNNFSLRAAYYRLEQAKANYSISDADFYPTVNGSAGMGNTESETDNVRNNENDFSLSISASYEIDLWGKIASLNEAARYNYLSSDMDLQTAAISLSAEVATKWYQLKDKRNRLDITNKQIDYNKNALDIINLQFKTGQVAIADVIQQKQLIESNLATKTRLEEEVTLNIYALNTLLGVAKDSIAIPETKEFSKLPQLPSTGIPINLIANRPDVKSAFLQLKAEDENLGAAIADRYPSLSLSASASTSGEQVSDLFDNWLANIAAGLVAPIIDGGTRKATVVKQEAVVAEKLNTYNQVALEAIAEIESALVQEEKQKAYIAYVDRQLELATEAMNQIKYRYIKGSENYQRVITSIVSMQNLEQTKYSSRLRLIENRIKLCQSLASGWQVKVENSSKKEDTNAK